jgi:formamidopyrimidine-DNA glycosylase
MAARGSVAAMPELPEVETLRSLLEPDLVGRRLERVAIHDPRLTAPRDPDAVAAELAGERIVSLRRRGKYLLIGFDSGRTLVVHLRMTGSLRRDGGEDDRHLRALLELDDGSTLAYRDLRRFGTWQLLEAGELEPYLDARLGPEPLAPGFGAAALRRRLAGRRAPVKSALLDQRTVAGVGNIYADEALWRARIHPLSEAGGLSGRELGALARGIRSALELGLARQGSTLRDYALPDGRSGSMQNEFKVYGRLGEPCDRCGTPIERIRVGGRGTWYCPQCQRRHEPEGAA